MVSRYGAKIRKQVEAVLKLQRASYACPRCGKRRVKRVGYARWRCRACGAEFAGGAYTLTTTVGEVARKILVGEKVGGKIPVQAAESKVVAEPKAK